MAIFAINCVSKHREGPTNVLLSALPLPHDSTEVDCLFNSYPILLAGVVKHAEPRNF